MENKNKILYDNNNTPNNIIICNKYHTPENQKNLKNKKVSIKSISQEIKKIIIKILFSIQNYKIHITKLVLYLLYQSVLLL